jgi:hypothetical protein
MPPFDSGSANEAEPSHLSPSLRRREDGSAAYEVKFLVSEAIAATIERHAAAGLSLDPHADPKLGNAYRTTTLYCDTPALDVFHRSGSGRNRKYRVRRYGSAPLVFLERKTKRGTEVSKRRVGISLDELGSLDAHGVDWPGDWFRRRLTALSMKPVCSVSYDRTAYLGGTSEGPLRLTFDRRLRGQLVNDWDLSPIEENGDLLDGSVIVEFKFQGSLPAVGKRLVEDLMLVPGPASKYRRFLSTTAVPTLRGQDSREPAAVPSACRPIGASS